MRGVDFAHYRDEDYLAVCDFLIELNRQERMHINWNWARFEWMIEHPEFDKSKRSAFGLWRSEGRIVGARYMTCTSARLPAACCRATRRFTRRYRTTHGAH